MKKIILLLSLMATGLQAFLQSPQNIQDQLAKNGEVYFKFIIDSYKQLPDITKVVSVDNVEGNTVFAYANEKELTVFESLGLSFDLLPHPNEGFDPPMADFEQIKNVDAWDFYPTYDAYVSMMHQFENDYPSLCKVDTIGLSVNGRALLVARISDNVGVDEAEPEFLYTSTIHGDEATGYVLMLRLIDSLLSAYGSDPRVTNLVNNMDIFINPLANPDGTYNGGNNTLSGATRYNANSYDLNRNFPDVVEGLHPNTQPETYRFMEFAESRHFVMAANFHGGTEVFNYPWDHKHDLCADDDWWQYVGHEYADTAQAHSPSNYMNGYDDGITNGADWYVIDGGRQDYMNFFHQCREVTIEISDTKLIPASQLEAHWEYNRRSLLNYMEQCLYGVRGIVTDAVSGQPVRAEVYVGSHEIDGDSSWVYSDGTTGNYHRLLNAGAYNIRFSAPCYEEKVMYGITVQNHNTTVVNVQLNPAGNAADFSASPTFAFVGENISLTDLSCGNPNAWQWSITGPGSPTFENGTTSQSQDPEVSFNTPGSYDVSLTTTSASGSFTETKTGYINISSCIYCEASSANPTEEWISNVMFNTINNSTGGVNGYEDYTSISTEVEKGQSYNLSVSVGSIGNWNENVMAFIDWDQSCDFDVTETYSLGSTFGPGTVDISITVPVNAAFGITRLRIVERYNTVPGSCGLFTYGEVEDYSINIPAPGFDLDLKLFLQGPFNGSEMNTTLTLLPDFPTSQPYDASPWNYSGSESVSALPNAQIVDWILLELRDAPTANAAIANTMVARQAAFLLKDGSVVGTDGISLLHFDIPVDHALFAVIHHRNHLDMMSANALTLSGTIYSYDFSDGIAKAFQNGQTQVTTGIFGMTAGDNNPDNVVNIDDLNPGWSTNSGKSGFYPEDINFDGEVNNLDKDDIWYINVGLNAKLPDGSE
ncbi:MAG: hypothetical protein KDC05_01010 [Bacteroidales bacterium]|nr:hypothetical protein [Bacteroidales bacterium]